MVSDAVLETLEWADLDDIACWFGLEDHFFLGEWVDALACFGCWLAFDADFHHAWDIERAACGFFEILLDHLAHDIKDLGGFLFGDADMIGDGGEDFRLGAWLVLGGSDASRLLGSGLLGCWFTSSGLPSCGFSDRFTGCFFRCFLRHLQSPYVQSCEFVCGFHPHLQLFLPDYYRHDTTIWPCF